MVDPQMNAADVAAHGDLVAAELVDSLLAALQPKSTLVCVVDEPPGTPFDLPGGMTVTATCTLEELADSGGPEVDLIWVRGHPSWHAMRALVGALEHLPVIVVDGAAPDPVPGWITNEAYATQLTPRRARRRVYVSDFQSWPSGWAPTRRSFPSLRDAAGGCWCRRSGARRLRPWLAGRAAMLDALSAAHRDRAELVARNFALFELLDRSQRTATAVVRSTRFRVGTRLVRLGRQVTRKPEFFAAPTQILKRQKAVEAWRSRLAADRPVGESPPVPGALRVTYVLPELRLSGGALVVMQLVNELRLIGADARIATFKARDDAYRARLLAEPMLFDSETAMLQRASRSRCGGRDTLEYRVDRPETRRLRSREVRGVLHSRLRSLVLSGKRRADAGTRGAELRTDPASDRHVGMVAGPNRARPQSRAQARPRARSRVLLSAPGARLPPARPCWQWRVRARRGGGSTRWSQRWSRSTARGRTPRSCCSARRSRA